MLLLRSRIHFKYPDLSIFIDSIIESELAESGKPARQHMGRQLCQLAHFPFFTLDHRLRKRAGNALRRRQHRSALAQVGDEQAGTRYPAHHRTVLPPAALFDIFDAVINRTAADRRQPDAFLDQIFAAIPFRIERSAQRGEAGEAVRFHMLRIRIAAAFR